MPPRWSRLAAGVGLTRSFIHSEGHGQARLASKAPPPLAQYYVLHSVFAACSHMLHLAVVRACVQILYVAIDSECETVSSAVRRTG